ncbi:urotensin-related peptide 1 [Polyodon spathula]|uniref:urotensin-related peptide 1 n=1 Tax=Polyodon spathula TaxID=7913 RepID=UPI001B7EA91B|nr:urotensin-related peptide 1 [Polyodon spathula]
MQSWALVSIVAVLSATCRSQAYPLYSGSNHVPQGDLYQRMGDSEEGDLTDNEGMRQFKNVYPLLLTQDEDTQGTLRAAWVKGTKDSAQHEKISNMANDIKSAVLKLAAAEKLITHSFVKSDQNTQKPAKRACFWKYCVTK